jgi:formate dehydrogenase major subunit
MLIDKIHYDTLPDDTIYAVAKRHGIAIPTMCYKEGYRPDGNCRACVVEIEGERTLAASCCRLATPDLKVHVNSTRAITAREGVQALLTLREECHIDLTHPAIAVNHDACIACGLCVRACREVQGNDVIGLSMRGSETRITFDLDAALGGSTCVACGECVQACPTGALLPQGEMLIPDKKIADKKVADKKVADKKIASLCPFCGVGCQTEVSVKNNKIIEVRGINGPSNEGRLCVKGRFGFDYIHHGDRLTHPLIREKDGYKKATWDEALTLIANKFKSYAPEQIAGFGSAKGSNEEAYLFQKFMRVALKTNNVDHCTRLCHASSVAALLEGLNSAAVSAPFMAASDADCIIVIGARPAENHPVAATYLKNAAAKGAKLYVLDPRGQSQGISRYATGVLQFKPSKDVALLNAMLYTIIEEDLVNHAYIAQYVEGYEELKTALIGQSPEIMAEICGIEAIVIRDLARVYATSPRSIIFWGMGISQHIHGTDNARCLIALALITGQIGREGTGLHPLRGQNNVQGASDAGLIPFAYPDYAPVDNPVNQAKFEKLWNTTLNPQRGLTVVEIINASYEGAIKALYVAGENPAMSDPDQNHARKALQKLDFLVVQDIFMTETAEFADVVLPAAAHAEKDGTYTNTNRQVQMGRKAVQAPGIALADWEIIQQLALKMGVSWNYTSAKDIYNEMREAMPSLTPISWERLARENSVTYPVNDQGEGQDIIFRNGFPTPNGKAKLIPVYVTPPHEEADDEFPFILTTGRLLEHWHTGAMTRRAGVLDALEPEATVSLHPTTLGKYNLHSGESVKVSTRRGEIILKTRVDADIPENMLFIPFAFREAAANFLTTSALDPYGKIPEFKHASAKLERVIPLHQSD